MSDDTPRFQPDQTPSGPESAPDGGSTPAEKPKFDPDAPSHTRPKLRPVHGFAAKQGERVLLGLADPRQISQKVVFTAPQAQLILPHLTGENDLDSIVEKVGRGLTRPMVEDLVAQLADAALLEGPKFEAMLLKMRSEFDSSDTLPPAKSAQFADLLVNQAHGQNVDDETKASEGPSRLREQFDKWIDESLKEAPDPSFDTLPRGLIAPCLDYHMGWLNYGNAYGRMRVVDTPDRVVVLGVNHFGQGLGVVGCDKSFRTPLGVAPLDRNMLDHLKGALGEEGARQLLHDRYDHEREHSIELQIAWLQHVFGPSPGESVDDQQPTCPPLFAALIPDPLRIPEGGAGPDALPTEAFVEALAGALSSLGGKTLIVCSANLSHVGPQFGDPKPLTGDPEGEAARQRVLEHDRDMLNMVLQAKPDDLVTSLTWQQNATRWGGVGPITATLRTLRADASNMRLLNYAAGMDQQGMAMVSSAALAIS